MDIEKELQFIAKTIVADHGDVSLYFNISDFVKAKDGSDLSKSQIEFCERKFQSSQV